MNATGRGAAMAADRAPAAMSRDHIRATDGCGRNKARPSCRLE